MTTSKVTNLAKWRLAFRELDLAKRPKWPKDLANDDFNSNLKMTIFCKWPVPKLVIFEVLLYKYQCQRRELWERRAKDIHTQKVPAFPKISSPEGLEAWIIILNLRVWLLLVSWLLWKGWTWVLDGPLLMAVAEGNWCWPWEWPWWNRWWLPFPIKNNFKDTSCSMASFVSSRLI